MNVNLARQARWRREWTRVTVALVLLALILGASGWTWRLDQAFYDSAMLLWRKSAPSDIVIVAIDDESLRTVGRWPWKRSVHAQVLRTLAQAQPKAILLDLLLSEPDPDPQQDQILADALAQASPVVLPVAFSGGPPGGGTGPLGALQESTWRGHELSPTPLLASQARLGHADVALDADGVMRWAHLRAGWEAASRPHLALALLEASGGQLHPRIGQQLAQQPLSGAPARAQTWRREQAVAIRYLGPPGSVEQVSYSAVLRGDVPPATFTGRTVLIGATAVGLGDGHQTPVSRGGTPMASVEITAQLMQMLRSGEGLRLASPLAVGLGSAALVLALMGACWRLSPRRSLTLCAATAIALPLLCMLIMSLGLWFPPSSFVLVALLVYPIWSWRRLEATSAFMSSELAELARQAQDSFWSPPAGQAAPRPEATRAAPVDGDVDFLEHQFSAVKTLSERLQGAKRLMAETLAELPCAVLVTDEHGYIQHANTQARALLRLGQVSGAQATPALASQRLAHLAPQHASDWDWLMRQVSQDAQTVHGEVVAQDGRRFLAGVGPLHLVGAPAQGCVICLTDISALKHAERQRDELLGFIAHDIRSPQASMISLVQLLRMTPPAMGTDEALDHIQELAQATVSLCEELLLVMRTESRPLNVQPFGLRGLLQQALREIAPQALARGVTLHSDDAAATEIPMAGDTALIKRALVNLLSNAVKFSPLRGTVEVQAYTEDEQGVVTVSDHGPGIAASDLARLFRRFERVESDEPLRTAPGIGLGLVFIDTVASRHGGRVDVRSTPGAGSSFELRLPRLNYHEAEPTSQRKVG